jgi:hypothetical protein
VRREAFSVRELGSSRFHARPKFSSPHRQSWSGILQDSFLIETGGLRAVYLVRPRGVHPRDYTVKSAAK